MSWFELAIVAFIVVSIGWHIWRGGAANPVGTGSLDRRVSALSGKVSALETRVGGVEGRLEELKEEAASTKDIERLEALGERTWRSVERIERIILEKGLGK